MLATMEKMHHHLIEFIESGILSENDFAEYCSLCGASRFIDRGRGFDYKLMKGFNDFKIKSFYTKEDHSHKLPYFVISLPGKSYLMYEIFDQVTVWVCYTEEKFRGKGYIYILLKELRDRYPSHEINIDTFSNSLKEYSKQLSFNIFQR